MVAGVGVVVTVAWRDIWHDILRTIQSSATVAHCQVLMLLALLPVTVANEQRHQSHHQGPQHRDANHCPERVIGHWRGGHHGERLLASDPARGTTVPWRTHTGPSLRVAPLSRTTMTWLGAVSTKHPWRTAFQAEMSGPAWGTETAPILGVAGPTMATLAELGTVGSPVSQRAWLRAVRAGPASQAVAGPIRRVAGGMVGTLAGHTAFAIAARLTGFLAEGASESGCANAVAILGDAGAPVLAGAGVATVGSPEALRAGLVAAGTCPPGLAQAVSMNRIAAVSMVTVTATGTAFAKLPLWAGELAVGPMPPGGTGTGSSLGAAGCLMGTLAAGIATEAPGSRWAGHRAVTTLPTFLADAGAVDGRAGDGIFAGAACGAIDSVGVRGAEASAVRSRVAGRAPAEAAVGLADAAVKAEAVLLAARPVRVLRAALVAVEARPARQARALPAHRVAAEAVLRVAGAGHLAAEAVEAVGAEALGAAVPGEAVFAQTRAVGRETAGARGAVARLSTVLPEAAHGALLAAPVPRVSRSTATLPGESVTEASVVTATFLGAVGSMEALGAGQGADGARPARWAAAGILRGLEDAPILARRSAGAGEASAMG